jgi:hypothetical protein
MNFLLSLLSGHADDPTHSVIARYGRGAFQGPAAEASVSGSRLKVSGSYLYLPVLGQLLADRCEADLAVQGTVVSKADIEPQLKTHGLEVIEAKKRGGFKYRVEGNLSGSQLRRLYEDLWEPAVLLKAKSTGFLLTASQSVPKPNGFSDPSFCSLTMPASDENLMAAFRCVVPGAEATRFGSLSVTHTIKIDDIVVPTELAGKPASMVRLMAKRKGVLTRQLTVDGRSVETQHEFVA